MKMEDLCYYLVLEDDTLTIHQSNASANQSFLYTHLEVSHQFAKDEPEFGLKGIVRNHHSVVP